MYLLNRLNCLKNLGLISAMLITILFKESISNDEHVNNNKMDEWIQKVNNWGPRKTASTSHLECADWITEEFEKIGLVVQRDNHEFSRYEISKIHLSVENDPQDIKIAAAYPFSGLTNEDGVNGPLVLIEGKNYKKAKNKIAVVEVPNKPIPTEILFDIHENLLSGENVLSDEIINPVLSSTLFGPDLEKLKKAGAVAVIAVWKNMSEGMADGQYLPFTFPYRSIPAVWLAGQQGERILNAARNNTKANLVLNGTISKASAPSLWTVFEGEKRNESILIITHTDGTNPVEENGFLGLLSIANRLAASGKKPERNVIFIAVAGHLRLADISTEKRQQATTVWLREHTELWDGKKGHSKAVAAIVLEHLGAMEWVDKQGGFGPNGDPAIEITYATTPVMREIVEKNWKKRTFPYRAAVVTPRSLVHFGEGEPIFEMGIPEISILAIPSYLLSEITMPAAETNTDEIRQIINKDIIVDQCNIAYDVLNDLLKIPSESIGKVERVGFWGKLKDLFKAAKVILSKE